MLTILGLADKEHSDATVVSRKKPVITTIDHHRCTVEYNELVRRIWIPIEVSACNSTVKYKTDAIWDTGAINSCISNRLVKRLNLQPVATGNATTPMGQFDIAYYTVDVWVSDGISIPFVQVAGYPLENHDADFLIGMDIISKGDFCIRNSEGKTIATFEYKG